MKLYRDHFAPQLLKVEGDAGGLERGRSEIRRGQRVVVKLVNPSDAAREVSVELGGFQPGNATLQMVAPDNLSARNTMEHPNFVHAVAGKVARDGGTVQVSLPRWSVAVLEVASGAPVTQTKVRDNIAQPDVLTLRNGRPVPDAQTWWKLRRPEILELLETQEYGRIPAGRSREGHAEVPSGPDRPQGAGRQGDPEADHHFVHRRGGFAEAAPAALRPRQAGWAPAILGLNFNGNQTVDADPGIELPEIWVVDPAAPKPSHPGEPVHHIQVRAGADTRGKAASQWQVEKILDRGYALATMYCGDIEPDFPGGIEYGVREMFLGGSSQRRARRMGRHRSLGMGSEPCARLPPDRFGRQWAKGCGVRLLASGQGRGVGRRAGSAVRHGDFQRVGARRRGALASQGRESGSII